MASNTSLSDSDIATLKTIGGDTVRAIVALVVESILYTIYFILVAWAGRILLADDRRNKKTVATFAVVLIMLLLDTSLCILDINNAIREITETLTSDSSDSLQDRYNNRYSSFSVENAPFSFMYNLGDVIIVWRTYAFYYPSRERWLLLLPTALLVGSFTISGLISYCIANGAVSEVDNFIHPELCVNIQITSYAITFVTTGVATLMICWKTWVYRRVVHYDSHTGNRKTRAEKIMIVLIESGMLYLIFLLAVLIDDVGPVPALESSTPGLVFSTEIWSYMLSHIIGIYPAIIVILVHSRKSYIEGVTNTTIDTIPEHSSQKWAAAPFPWGSTSRVIPSDRLPGRSHVLDINVHEMQETHGRSSTNDRSATNGDLESQVSRATHDELESHKSREKLPRAEASRADNVALE